MLTSKVNNYLDKFLGVGIHSTKINYQEEIYSKFYSEASIKSKLFLNVGAGNFVEKSKSEIQKLVKVQKENLEKVEKETIENLNKLQSRIIELQTNIQKEIIQENK